MKKNRRQTSLGIPVGLAMAAILLAAPVSLRASSATALVSATVLGQAETDIAAGAVTVSNISKPGSDQVVIAKAGSPIGSGLVSLAEFHIAGGYSASYSVALPATVTVKNGEGEFHVSGFGQTGSRGSLASDGSARLGVGAAVAIPEGQAPGVYSGSYPVTIAFD